MIKLANTLDHNEDYYGDGVKYPELISHIPTSIDEYLVIVHDENDWQEIHNYIITESEIDGIPNRKIECSNVREYSLRSSVYLMSNKECEILKTHPKIEDVLLNPQKYPQPTSLFTNRYKKQVSFTKPYYLYNLNGDIPSYNNGIRSNWSHLFATNPSSKPFKGVGVALTSMVNSDVQYSLTGRGVDAVIIDSGICAAHPEFITDDKKSRVKDVILDGPFKIDPDYFITNNLTYQKFVDGVDCGVGIASTSALAWWSDSSKRSVKFQSGIGTIGQIDPLYSVSHSLTDTYNLNNDQIVDGHGTSCASQIGGKSFGFAFDCNLWAIRIALGYDIGYIDGSTALDICTLFHKGKKISQNNNPDPTIINCSFGATLQTQNASGTVYYHSYRGTTCAYIGTGNDSTVPPTSSATLRPGSCRNVLIFTTYGLPSGQFWYLNGSSGGFNPGEQMSNDIATNSSAENAISSGCILVAAAGNNGQKLSDYSDLDFNNYYVFNGGPYNGLAFYINRVGGVQKGFSGTHEKGKGSIRVGALDCSVEPSDSKQGSPAYAIRKVVYSNNGPMIDIWSPADSTLAAGAADSIDFQRQDDPYYYDTFFAGTSSAAPNTCSVIALYLESNRKADQSDVRNWINRHGSTEINLSDPYPSVTSDYYWCSNYNATYDFASSNGDSYNVRGCGNLRGAPKRVLKNPYANNTKPSMSNVNISGISFTQS